MQTLPSDDEDGESTQETRFWLSQPGITASMEAARAEIQAGHAVTEDQIRAEFHMPR